MAIISRTASRRSSPPDSAAGALMPDRRRGQQRGEFHSYHHCYEAAQGEVANLGPDVRWDCVLKYRDGEQE